MLKISEVKRRKRSLTLQLEGCVVGPWAGELMQVASSLLTDNVKLALDLAGVSFADAEGVSTLTSLNRRGVKLLQTSPFVAEQLKTTNGPDA